MRSYFFMSPVSYTRFAEQHIALPEINPPPSLATFIDDYLFTLFILCFCRVKGHGIWGGKYRLELMKFENDFNEPGKSNPKFGGFLG
jgi:hypothetical protein